MGIRIVPCAVVSASLCFTIASNAADQDTRYRAASDDTRQLNIGLQRFQRYSRQTDDSADTLSASETRFFAHGRTDSHAIGMNDGSCGGDSMVRKANKCGPQLTVEGEGYLAPSLNSDYSIAEIGGYLYYPLLFDNPDGIFDRADGRAITAGSAVFARYVDDGYANDTRAEIDGRVFLRGQCSMTSTGECSKDQRKPLIDLTAEAGLGAIDSNHDNQANRRYWYADAEATMDAPSWARMISPKAALQLRARASYRDDYGNRDYDDEYLNGEFGISLSWRERDPRCCAFLPVLDLAFGYEEFGRNDRSSWYVVPTLYFKLAQGKSEGPSTRGYVRGRR